MERLCQVVKVPVGKANPKKNPKKTGKRLEKSSRIHFFSFSIAGILAVGRCSPPDPGSQEPADQSDPEQQDPPGLSLFRVSHPHPALVRAGSHPTPSGGVGKGGFPAFPSLPTALCGVGRFKNGQGNMLDGGNYKAHENGSLEMFMTRKEDQGIYTCVAINILGKDEAQVRLEVKGRGTEGPKSWIFWNSVKKK